MQSTFFKFATIIVNAINGSGNDDVDNNDDKDDDDDSNNDGIDQKRTFHLNYVSAWDVRTLFFQEVDVRLVVIGPSPTKFIKVKTLASVNVSIFVMDNVS